MPKKHKLKASVKKEINKILFGDLLDTVDFLINRLFENQDKCLHKDHLSKAEKDYICSAFVGAEEKLKNFETEIKDYIKSL